MQPEISTDEAARRVDAMIGFAIHAAIYAVVIAILIGLNVYSGAPWWAQWPALGWGCGLLLHGLLVYARVPRAVAVWRLRKIRDVRGAGGR